LSGILFSTSGSAKTSLESFTSEVPEGLLMTRQEACKILGLAVSFSASDLKSAFRQAALKTHPDKGGNTLEFLKVHAAYERLMNDGSFADSEEFKETPEELRIRLVEIARAFEFIDSAFRERYPTKVEHFAADLRQRMTDMDSKDALLKHWPNEVDAAWGTFTTQMGEWLKSQTEQVAVDFNQWLTTVWAEHLNEAKNRHVENKWSSSAFWIPATIIGLFFSVLGFMLCSAYSYPFWFSFFLLPFSLPLADYFYQQESENRSKAKISIPQLNDDNLLMDANLFKFPLKNILLSDEAAYRVGFNGAWMGWMIGGPWGAVLGGIAGGLIGWFKGLRLEKLKEMVFTESCGQLDPLVDGAEKEWHLRLKHLKEEYLQRAQENYKEAARRTIKLLAEK
jgi:curved DNA-binding protein CbpA